MSKNIVGTRWQVVRFDQKESWMGTTPMQYTSSIAEVNSTTTPSPPPPPQQQQDTQRSAATRS